MSLSPEAFEQALSELADRADAHQVPDRVPDVRGRARRTARRRAGAVAAALTVAIVLASGVAGFGGLPRLRGQAPADKPTPPGPFLNVQLVRDEAKEATITPRISGSRVLVVTVVLHGRVPQWSGYQAGAVATDNLWEMLFTPDNSGGTQRKLRPTQKNFHCAPDAPLVDIDATFSQTIQYAPDYATPMLGPHKIRFTAGACAPIGLVQKTATFVMR
jgi:hypothetical protein